MLCIGQGSGPDVYFRNHTCPGIRFCKCLLRNHTADGKDNRSVYKLGLARCPRCYAALHPFWNDEGLLTPEQIDMYYMACYDLDRFRRFLFQSSFFKLFEVDENRVEAIQGDDLELLDFAMQWLKFSLFKEESMKIKRSVLESKRGTVSQSGQGIDG